MSNRLCILLAAFWLPFAVAITPARTVIRSQATAVVAGERYFSNEVESVVTAVCGLALMPRGDTVEPAHLVRVIAGDTVSLPYRLTNTGNDTSVYPLGVAVHPDSNWSPVDEKLYLDGNGNGRIDAGERTVTEIELEQDESANLILLVQTPQAGSGAGWIEPISSCPDGTESADNFAEIEITSGPILALRSEVIEPDPAPGELATFETVLTNAGTAAAEGEVIVTDLIDEASLDGLSYVSGSARSSSGLISYFDGSQWRNSEGASVVGVRLTLPRLARNQEVKLEFDVRIASTADPGGRENTVAASGPGGPVRALALFEIRPLLEYHFGPKVNPEAWPEGEGSVYDQQVTSYILVNQPECFELSIVNFGTGSDSYQLIPEPLPEGVTGTFRTMAGTQLQLPVPLDAGETIDFQFCITASEAAGPQVDVSEGTAVTNIDVVIEAVSQKGGGRNSTSIQVGPIVSGPDATLTLSADPAVFLDVDDEVSYLLRVENEASESLTDVVVRFPLPEFTPSTGLEPEFRSASGGGEFDSGAKVVRWRLDEIGAGEVFFETVVLRMPSVLAEGQSFVLPAAFSLVSAELTNPRTSNQLLHSFPVQSLLIESSVSPTIARVGEVVRYEIHVINPTRLPVRARLGARLPERTLYRTGSALLGVGDDSVQVEPVELSAPATEVGVVARRAVVAANLDELVGPGGLVWDLSAIPELELAPTGESGSILTLTYEAALLPGVASNLLHLAVATGTSDLGGHELSLAASTSTVSLEVVEDAFHQPKGLLTGRVFFDADDDGTYSKGSDMPLAGVRLVLANGWQTNTDSAGLYAFRELSPGSWAILLDSRTAPFQPREAAAEGRTPFQRLVRVDGVTVADFPLRAPDGRIEVGRQTTLVFGPVTVEKRLEPTGEGTWAVLTISSEEPLEDLQLTDPLPQGGEETWTFEHFQGTRSVRHLLPADTAMMTDPQVRWRDPFQ